MKKSPACGNGSEAVPANASIRGVSVVKPTKTKSELEALILKKGPSAQSSQDGQRRNRPGIEERTLRRQLDLSLDESN